MIQSASLGILSAQQLKDIHTNSTTAIDTKFNLRKIKLKYNFQKTMNVCSSFIQCDTLSSFYSIYIKYLYSDIQKSVHTITNTLQQFYS